MQRQFFVILICLLLGATINMGVAWLIHQFDRFDSKSAWNLYTINAETGTVIEGEDAGGFRVVSHGPPPSRTQIRSMSRAVRLVDGAVYDRTDVLMSIFSSRAGRLIYATLYPHRDEIPEHAEKGAAGLASEVDEMCDPLGDFASVLTHEMGWPMPTVAWSSVKHYKDWSRRGDANWSRFNSILRDSSNHADWKPVPHDTFLPDIILWPGFAANSAFYGGLAWIIFIARGMSRRDFRLKRGRCPCCAYDLRDDLAGGCPECGWRRLDPSSA